MPLLIDIIRGIYLTTMHTWAKGERERGFHCVIDFFLEILKLLHEQKLKSEMFHINYFFKQKVFTILFENLTKLCKCLKLSHINSTNKCLHLQTAPIGIQRNFTVLFSFNFTNCTQTSRSHTLLSGTVFSASSDIFKRPPTHTWETKQSTHKPPNRAHPDVGVCTERGEMKSVGKQISVPDLLHNYCKPLSFFSF